MAASLVIQTSFLGDMVLTTPLLAHLADAGPVDVVSTPASAGLLADHPAARDVIVYDKRRRDRGLGGLLRVAGQLRAASYAAAYLAQGSVRSGALALAAGIRERVGFASSAGRWFYTTRVPPIDNIHHAARLLALATRVPERAVDPDVLRPRLYPGAPERSAVDALLASARIGSPIIALAPGSVWVTKRWPYYAELARALHDEAQLVIVGAAADRPLAQEILAAAPDAIDTTGCLSLLGSAELIRRAALLVTNDSAPQHLASAVNTPTLAIFGPTVPEFGFGPLASHAAVAGHDALACRPCDRHGPRRCPLGHWRCMREITPETVASLVRTMAREV